MNEDDLREALRPSAGIEPLDPGAVIAGARRRRKRSLATGGAAAVAVLAVIGASVLVGTRPTGLPAVERPTPSVSTPKPSRTTSPGPNVAALVAQCKAELQRGQQWKFGPGTAKKALLVSTEGTLIVIADSKHWAACDNGYRGAGAPVEMSARAPSVTRRPKISDSNAFAVANNVVTKAGKDFDYYWAAGLLPDGVAAVRYSFPGGSSVEATVSGGYWMMQQWVAMAGRVNPERVRVQLVGPGGAVLKTFVLEPGVQTCEQISHGC